MTTWIDTKYIDLVGSRLHNFRRKSGSLYQCSCPICNEYYTSSKQRKAIRGYFYDKSGWRYICHRCGAAKSISEFLEFVDTGLYQEYLKERLQERGGTRKLSTYISPKKTAPEPSNDALRHIHKVSRLDKENPARQYLESRLIPQARLRELYLAPNFMAWTNTILKDKFGPHALSKDEPRIIIPFKDKTGTMHAFQGRSLDKDSELKYITIAVDETIPTLYGLDRINLKQPILATEGPIDAMFLENCLASAGSDIGLKLHGFEADDVTVIYDNERRSKQTVAKISKAINRGFKVFIWPESIEHKDVNDCIISGIAASDLQAIIQERTFTGMRATLELTNWRKI